MHTDFFLSKILSLAMSHWVCNSLILNEHNQVARLLIRFVFHLYLQLLAHFATCGYDALQSYLPDMKQSCQSLRTQAFCSSHDLCFQQFIKYHETPRCHPPLQLIVNRTCMLIGIPHAPSKTGKKPRLNNAAVHFPIESVLPEFMFKGFCDGTHPTTKVCQALQKVKVRHSELHQCSGVCGPV